MGSIEGDYAKCVARRKHERCLRVYRLRRAFHGFWKAELMIEQLKAGETPQDEELLALTIIAEVLLLVYDLEGSRTAGGTQEVG